MPFQIANVRRTEPAADATFDLILRESEDEIKVEGCTLVKRACEFTQVSLRDAKINAEAAKAVTLKVIAALSFR